ncbi:hypothetical protein GCM10027053_52650 [Intrasporangium mesophilum]
MHLPGRDVEVDTVEGDNVSEGLGDPTSPNHECCFHSNPVDAEADIEEPTNVAMRRRGAEPNVA